MRRGGRGAGRGKMGRARAWSIWEGRGEGRSPASTLEEELCRHGIHMRRGSRRHLGKCCSILTDISVCCYSKSIRCID